MYSNYTYWKTTPLTETPALSVVIPAYNEAERIVPTIGAIAAQVCEMGFPWELIVSDDGSTDDTADIVEELHLANLRLLRAPANAGKGNAVQRGMLAARGAYILFADADNSTPIEELPNLLSHIQNQGYDLAVGSRAAGGAEEASKSLFRKTLSTGLRWLVQYGFRIGVKDSQCGFKLYTREAARQICDHQTLMGFSFDLEHLYLAQKYGYRVAEVPVEWIDAPGSKVDGLKEVQRFLRDLVKIKLNDWNGRYEPTHSQTENRTRYNASTR